MRFAASLIAALLTFTATGVLAAPVPQLAGEGSAANSILSSTDNGVGYGTENAEDKIAGNIATAKGSVPAAPATRRQLAGEGSAADSVLTDTDSGVGYGIENAEDNIAANIASAKGGAAAPAPAKRQLDKISNGAPKRSGMLLGLVGSVEESTLESEGSSVPKRFRRQLDKVSKGAQSIGSAAGVGAETAPVTTEGVNLDGTLTSDAANAGAEAGSTEESTLENAGSSVPKL